MSRKIYVETLPSGEQQYVSIKRSRSHGHHHHDHGTVKVSREDLDRLKERERTMAEANQVLFSETQSLKTNLASAQVEINRLARIVPQLESQNSAFYADNQALRRSLEHADDYPTRHRRDPERLQVKVGRLEKENIELKSENSDLSARVRSLSRLVDQNLSRRVSDLLRDLNDWKDKCLSWRARHEDLQLKYDRIQATLESRTERMEAYEDILRRRGFI